MKEPDVLLLLTNQELWPGIICTSHFKPKQVVLLHGNTVAARKEPAERLRDLLLREKLVDQCTLHEIDDDELPVILDQLNNLALPDDAEVALGFNGATKLMAVACFQWAIGRRYQAFYLETDNEIQRFRPDGTGIACAREDADLARLSRLNPVETVRSHLYRSEIRRQPRILTLTSHGGQLPLRDALEILKRSIVSDDERYDPIICRDGKPWRPQSAEFDAAGERFELMAALALLKFGVEQIAHGVELSSRGSQAREHKHAELDLVFIWRGRLWVVECKDHEKAERKGRRIWDSLKRNVRLNELDVDEQAFVDELGAMLRRKYKKTLKERVLAAQECGGALAQVVLAVRDEPSGDVREFAESNRVHVARESSLERDLATALDVKLERRPQSWLDQLVNDAAD